jgi:hypothetical protein
MLTWVLLIKRDVFDKMYESLVEFDMKKILNCFLVGFLFVSLTGCSNLDGGEDPNVVNNANVIAIPIQETDTGSNVSEPNTMSETDTMSEFDPVAEIVGYWELTKVDGSTDTQSGPFGFMIGSDMSMMSMQIMEDGSGLIPAGSTHPMALMVQRAIKSADDKGIDYAVTMEQDDVLYYLTSEENSQYYSVKLSDGILLLQNCDDEDGLPIYYFQRVNPYYT